MSDPRCREIIRTLVHTQLDIEVLLVRTHTKRTTNVTGSNYGARDAVIEWSDSLTTSINW